MREQLAPERKARLDALGFGWAPRDAAWESMFEELRRYQSQYGNCNVSDRREENPQLGKWVSHQRQRQKEGILGADQRTRLDALGFDWGISQSNWEAMFTRLKRHKEHFGHCNVPGTEDPQLSNWVQSQRQRLKRGTLQADQRTRLDVKQ